MIKVSVVMAVYNGAQYLEEQMDSIRRQDFRPDEVIICDDVSSDASPEIIRQYIEAHGLEDSWRLYRNKKNLGYADNFHKGMRKAGGEYIFFCDQDDIWLPDKIGKMTRIMDENPQIQMLGSEYEPFYCTEDAPRIAPEVLKRMTNDGSLEQVRISYRNIFIGCEGCTMCVRRGLLEKAEKYWFSGWAHDEYVWKMSQCMGGCYIYHCVGLKRRLHSNNVSKRKMHKLDKRVRFLQNLLAGHEKMLRFAEEQKNSQEKIKIIQDNIVSVQMRIRLLQNREIYYAPILAFQYFRCYHSRKSIPVEFLMAFRG